MSERAQSRPQIAESAAKATKAESRARRPLPTPKEQEPSAEQTMDRPNRFAHDFSDVTVVNTPPSGTGRPLPEARAPGPAIGGPPRRAIRRVTCP